MFIKFVIRDLYRLVLVSHFYYLYLLYTVFCVPGNVSRSIWRSGSRSGSGLGALSDTKLIPATDKIQMYQYIT